MTERDPEDILKRAAGAPHEVDPALLARISGAIASSLRPVRPLPPAWMLAGGLFLICQAVAVAGAAALGLHGIAKLSATEIAAIFPVLAIFTWIAGRRAAGEMTPGGPRRLSAAAVLAGGVVALVALFALLFHDYGTERFVPQGLVCLTAGLAHALACGLGSWLLLRRGFSVSPAAAGLAAGTLAGMAGVTMLELHCPNLQAMHVMVWHVAVMPVSAAAGALLSWSAQRGGAR